MVADKAAKWGVCLARPGLSLALLLALVGCGGEPAEQRLRERIADMEAAIEERDAGAFMEGVAEDFVGEAAIDRRQLRQLLAINMMRNARISAVLGPLSIEMLESHARVEVEVVVSGGAGRLLPERAQAYSISSAWRDGEDGWQVVEASWEPRL